jgi:soluble lytic murein transglycosylase
VAAGRADLVTATEDHLQQRKLFLQAEKTLQKNDRKRFMELQAQLKNYCLYPYLQYRDLTNRLQALPNQEIQTFIQKYPDSPLTKNLYLDWIETLATQDQWQDLATYYDEKLSDTAQTCHYLRTQLMFDYTDMIDQKLKDLWLVGYSQPDACDPIFEYGLTFHKIDTTMIWQRIQLSLDKHNPSFVEYLATRLPDTEQKKTELLLTIYNNPYLLNDFTPDNDTEFNTFLFYYGIIQLAIQNPEQAINLLEKFKDTIPLSEQQLTKIHTTIRDTIVRKGPEHGIAWLTNLPLDHLLPIIQQWQLQKSVGEQDWLNLITLFKESSPTLQTQPKWRYWYARSLEQQQNHEEAKILFNQLAKERHYYGLLSAHHLQQPLPINNKPLPITEAEYRTILKNPHIECAYELYALTRAAQGDAEWKAALKNMTEKERYNAARIAAAMKWPNVALLTTRTFAYDNDLTLRFPVLYQPLINKLGRKYNIPPALIFAMIRQESAYHPEAVSSSGALGLMQLMPNTAAYIAEKIHHPKPSKEMLHNANINIQLGSAYLDYLFAQHAEHPLVAIASYNAGPNRVKQWLPQTHALPADVWVETIPWQEPRNYVKHVFTYTMIYQHLLGKKYHMDDFLKNISNR